MADYGAKAVPCLVDEAKRNDILDWLAWLQRLLAQAGDLDGTQPPPETRAAKPARTYAARPYAVDVVVRRDERFPDPCNQGVNAEAFLYDAASSAAARRSLMMLYKRLREIDVPGDDGLHHRARRNGKPWGYYRDMSRQLWDEARHAMMGEVGFVALGVDWTKAHDHLHTGRCGLNTEFTPMERHAVLYFIEQGLMPKTGKRYEWEVGVGSPASRSRRRSRTSTGPTRCCTPSIGRNWYVSDIPGARKPSSTATNAGPRC